LTQTSEKPTLNSLYGIFPEKEAKSVSSASQKAEFNPNLGEADPGGLGASPQKKSLQKKKQKALVPLRRILSLTQISAEPTLGVWGLAPRRTLHAVFFVFGQKVV
jgi:hypothetical protein